MIENLFSLRSTPFFSEERGTPSPTPKDRAAFEAAKEEASKISKVIMNRLHFKFDRTLTGKELAISLKESLRQHGINPDDVMVRYFSKDRLTHALQTGSDRDRTSTAGYNGSYDKEQEWMHKLGIWDNAQVTYASPINQHLTGGADAPKMHDQVYAIYDKRFLHKISPASNGLHAFLGSAGKANIGFISDRGTLELVHPTQGAMPSGTDGPN